MTHVVFRLTMPCRSSWNGRWSGDNHNYTIVRDVEVDAATKLDGRSWSYSWSDGWRANVTAVVVSLDKDLPASDGFCGYDWMVVSILRYGKIYADHEKPEVTT